MLAASDHGPTCAATTPMHCLALRVPLEWCRPFGTAIAEEDRSLYLGKEQTKLTGAALLAVPSCIHGRDGLPACLPLDLGLCFFPISWVLAKREVSAFQLTVGAII